MICQKCQKENHNESKFCRFCGQKIFRSRRKTLIPEQIIESIPQNTNYINVKQSARPITNLFNWNFSTLKNKLLKNGTVIAILFSLLIITGAYAAPKINGYIKINKAIESAKKAEDAKDYNNALSFIASVSDYWMTDSKKQEIENLKEKQNKYIKYKEIFNSALEKEQAKKLEEARKLLLTIDSDFPEYNSVKDKLSDIQTRIEGGLRADADREAAARANAERQAQIEATQRERAQAEAQAATEAKQRSDAAAAAAAQAARDAEYRRQQADAVARDAEYRRQLEEQRRLEAQKAAFLDEMIGIYNRSNDGISYYNNAMSYYNAGSELAALAGFGQAKAIFSSTYSDSLSMQSSYTNLTGTYANAVNNLVSATRNYNNAADIIINHIGSGSSGTSGANNYTDNAYSFMQSVQTFLRSQGR